jgi:hypothetical protein
MFTMFVLSSGRPGTRSARYRPAATLDLAAIERWREGPGNRESEAARKIYFAREVA